MKRLSVIAFTGLMFSCRSMNSEYVSPIIFQDSFFVATNGGEVNTLAMQFVDRNKIITATVNEDELIELKRRDDLFQVVSRRKLAIEHPISNIHIKHDGNILCFTYGHGIYKVKQNFDSVKAISHSIRLKNLNDRYSIATYQQFPLIEFGGSLYFTPFQKKLEDYPLYLKSKIFTELSFSGDSLFVAKELVERNDKLSSFRFPYPTYCSSNGTIYYLYNCYDTLYKYNIEHDVLEKVHIGNRFYSEPKPYDYKKGLDLSNPSYNIRYNLQNFSYLRVLLNEENGHLLFIFCSPKTMKSNQSYIYGMIVDKELNLIGYCSLGKYYEAIGYCIFKITDSKYAIKKLTEGDEKLYYTFSF